MSIVASNFKQESRLFLPADAAANPGKRHIFYRKRLTLSQEGQPLPALLRCYGMAELEVALNGETIHYGPCRHLSPLRFYDEVPITLRPGENTLAFHQHLDFPTDAMGMLAEVAVKAAPKDEDYSQLLWDGTGLEGAFFQSYDPAASEASGSGFSELLDLSRGEGAWRQGLFPGQCPECIQSAELIPANHWEARVIPLFKEQPREALEVFEDDGALRFDFGMLVSGRVEIQGVGREEEVVVEYLEELTAGWSIPSGTPVMYADGLINAKGKEIHWKCQHIRAARYIRVRGIAPKGAQCRFMEYGYPLEPLGEGQFHSSDPALNRLAEISANTLRLCMEDIYMDCPHRDRQQWMDALASSRAALALHGVQDLTRKCLRQYLQGLREDGQLYSPALTQDCAVPDYTLLVFPFLHYYYCSTGDKALLEEAYPVLQSIVAGFAKIENADGLLDIRVNHGDFVYLDNTFELAKNGASSSLNALYCRALTDFARIGEVLGESVDWQRPEALRQRILKEYAHPQREGCFKDNLRRPEGGFMMVNFSCELGHWDGKLGVLEFTLERPDDTPLRLEIADYAGYEILLDGLSVAQRQREPSWSREPMYAPEVVEIPMTAGKHRLRFEVPWNALNWEIFIRDANTAGVLPVEEVQVGDAGGPLQPCRMRWWIPPVLSQSTQSYAAFAQIHNDPAKTLKMLESTFMPEYPRVYKSVRVPSFCTIAGAERERDPWVMPCNTPWPTFFLLCGCFENGGTRQGLEIIRQYWRDILADGCATTYEEWGRRSSLCHAWGATPVYFFSDYILGVRHDTIHTGQLLIQPDLADLEFAQGRVALNPQQSLWVKMHRDAATNVVHLHLTIPAAVKYTLDTSRLGKCQVEVSVE